MAGHLKIRHPVSRVKNAAEPYGQDMAKIYIMQVLDQKSASRRFHAAPSRRYAARLPRQWGVYQAWAPPSTKYSWPVQ